MVRELECKTCVPFQTKTRDFENHSLGTFSLGPCPQGACTHVYCQGRLKKRRSHFNPTPTRWGVGRHAHDPGGGHDTPVLVRTVTELIMEKQAAVGLLGPP